jgi:hypothetical protein
MERANCFARVENRRPQRCFASTQNREGWPASRPSGGEGELVGDSSARGDGGNRTGVGSGEHLVSRGGRGRRRMGKPWVSAGEDPARKTF